MDSQRGQAVGVGPSGQRRTAYLSGVLTLSEYPGDDPLQLIKCVISRFAIFQRHLVDRQS